jgi:hypothetical protein
MPENKSPLERVSYAADIDIKTNKRITLLCCTTKYRARHSFAHTDDVVASHI